uniref:Uncharacterized protein n=1 Tax=Amphimedon queenslandica TaxID=400682 RepID=A0A1X7VJH6_AMPQE
MPLCFLTFLSPLCCSCVSMKFPVVVKDFPLHLLALVLQRKRKECGLQYLQVQELLKEQNWEPLMAWQAYLPCIPGGVLLFLGDQNPVPNPMPFGH